MKPFAKFNMEYGKYFGKDFPTRVAVGIGLMPGAFVEIFAVAYKE